jgi:DnaK suppressor protein
MAYSKRTTVKKSTKKVKAAKTTAKVIKKVAGKAIKKIKTIKKPSKAAKVMKTATPVTVVKTRKKVVKVVKTVKSVKITPVKIIEVANVPAKDIVEEQTRNMRDDTEAAVITAKVTSSKPVSKTLVQANYMDDAELLRFRHLLEQRRLDLMREVDYTLSEMKDSSNFADPNDRATQEETVGLELCARDRERHLLKKIEEALQRIDSKEYGYCESCGVEIGLLRLEVRPTATLCIDCKTIAELRERRG